VGESEAVRHRNCCDQGESSGEGGDRNGSGKSNKEPRKRMKKGWKSRIGGGGHRRGKKREIASGKKGDHGGKERNSKQ